jgi:tartrate-resistant acid phosphatase type 5
MNLTPPGGITRRHLLRQAFYYSAAAALAGRGPALQAQTSASGDLHFLMLGDFGSHGLKPTETLEAKVLPAAGASATPTPRRVSATPTPRPATPTPRPATPVPLGTPGASPTPVAPSATPGPPAIPKQDLVAAAMQRYVQTRSLKTEGIFMLGDNFYGAMKGGVNSPRWQVGFEDMYPASAFPGPCWAMLGNHDYDEENSMKLASELCYASAHPNTRWTMPAKWYRVDWPTAKDPIVTCFILDSNYNNSLAYLTPKEISKQNAWLKSELEKPRAAWTIAFGHHPLFSNGPHGDSPALIKDWGPLFQKHGVAAYFCGHDHDLQHLEFDGISTSFVVSGGGGAGLTKLSKPERKLYSASVHGFTHLQINREKLIVRHIDPTLAQLHAFRRDLAGRVEILT